VLGVLLAIGVTVTFGWVLVRAWRDPEERWMLETKWRPKPETLASPWFFALSALFWGLFVVLMWVSVLSPETFDEDEDSPPVTRFTLPTVVIVPTTEPPLR
jgi:RsiW-degrading membrane proteinase PrsW (M82 family)